MDVTKTKQPSKSLQTNMLKPKVVADLQVSLQTKRFGWKLASPRLFCCFFPGFSGIFTCVLLSCFLPCSAKFICMCPFSFHIDMSSDERAHITVQKLYDVGLYVFAGWHEMMAQRELHHKFPLDPNPYKFMYNCNIYILPYPSTDAIMHQVRVCGATQNHIEETRQIYTWADTILKMRNSFLEHGTASKKPNMYGSLHVDYKVVITFPVSNHSLLFDLRVLHSFFLLYYIV